MTLSGQIFPGLWSYLPGWCGTDGWVKAKGHECHAALSDHISTLWRVDSEPLASALCATKFLPQEPVQGIKELLLMSQFGPTEGGNGGRGRPLTPSCSHPPPQWGHWAGATIEGWEEKAEGKHTESPRTDSVIHHHASANIWEQRSQFLQILQPATAASDSGGRLCRLLQFPKPSPGLEPGRHYLG